MRSYEQVFYVLFAAHGMKQVMDLLFSLWNVIFIFEMMVLGILSYIHR